MEAAADESTQQSMTTLADDQTDDAGGDDGAFVLESKKHVEAGMQVCDRCPGTPDTTVNGEG